MNETKSLKWKCDKCGADCEHPDNGKGRQEVACACGQGIIILFVEREGWLD
jgi:hypothetical protein